MQERREPTQKTTPKKGKPVEIPVPSREQVFSDLRRVTKARPRKKPAKKG